MSSAAAQPPSPGAGAAGVDPALAALRSALAAHRLPTAFAEQAWVELLERESEFVAEVGLEAIRRARQKRSEYVSREDVAEADRTVRRAAQTSLMAGVQTIGGIASGGGISGMIAWALASKPSPGILVACIIATLVGAAMIAFTLGRASRR